MTTILLIEDDETIAFGIREALKRKAYDVKVCASMEEAWQRFIELKDEIRLILLDINLPDGNGFNLCRRIKEQKDVPVIFLTVQDEVDSVTRGLDMGADDYITKPFHLSVLESRIAAVLRRVVQKDETVLGCGKLRLYKERAQVYLGEDEVTVTATEYRLLEILMTNKGMTLPRNRILEKLWDAQGNFVNDNTLTVTVKRLREKLNGTDYIKTVRGIGYRMEDKE